MNENSTPNSTQSLFAEDRMVNQKEFNLLNSLDYDEGFASFEAIHMAYQAEFSQHSSSKNRQFEKFESIGILTTERNLIPDELIELYEDKELPEDLDDKFTNKEIKDEFRVDLIEEGCSNDLSSAEKFLDQIEDNQNNSFFDEHIYEKFSCNLSEQGPKSNTSKAYSTSNKTSEDSPNNPGAQKLKRWSRSEDIALFNELYKECTKRHLNISDVFERATFNNKYKNLLNQVKKEVEWKGNDAKFLARIRRLGKDQTLSFRQFKLFRKLGREQLQVKEEVDFSSLVKYFPGKLEATLQNEFKEYLKTNHKVFKKLGNKS